MDVNRPLLCPHWLHTTRLASPCDPLVMSKVRLLDRMAIIAGGEIKGGRQTEVRRIGGEPLESSFVANGIKNRHLAGSERQHPQEGWWAHPRGSRDPALPGPVPVRP